MGFFTIRFVHGDGTWSHPWTIFAPDVRHALDRFLIETAMADLGEITIRKRPIGEASSFYGRYDVGGGATEHPTIEWAT